MPSLLVLAKGLDRAVLQRLEGPLRAGQGQGGYSRAAGEVADGALTIALSWLTLMALPESGGRLPEGFRAAVSAWGRVSLTGLALSLLERVGDLPLRCLPQPLPQE